MVSLILLFGGPRILSTASFSDMPCTLFPSSAVMMSPGFTPARLAGVSSIGLITLIHAVLLRHLDAEAAEFAARLHLHVAEDFAFM